MDDLRKLAEDKNIRDARKLYQYAQSKGYSVSVKDAAEALKHSVQRQVLSNGPRYKGHFASVGPGKDLQLDLIDWGANNLKAKRGGGQYALVGADVYTRKLAIQPLKTKEASAVLQAQSHIIERLVPHPEDNDIMIRTDRGKEFSGLERYGEATNDIHQYKDVRDRNGLAVVDAGIKHIKRDLAAEVGKERGVRWADVAHKVVNDINEKPNPSVFGPPDRVETNKIQDFKVLQRNAENFAHDNRNRVRMQNAIEEAETFRKPIDHGGRSFKPQYGPAKPFSNVDSEFVYHQGYTAALERGENGENKTTLLKQARPAAPGTGQFLGLLTSDTSKITTLPMGKQALKNEALALENILFKEGRLEVADLPRRIPGLRRKVDRFSNMTTSNWITRLYKDKFVITDGVVRLKRAVAPRPRPSSALILRPEARPSQAPRLPAKPSQAPAEPSAAPAKPKRDKNYFLGLRAMYS